MSVLVPRQGTDPHRAAAWAWVRARYAEHHPGWEVVEGELPAGRPWCKADAVAAALERASGEVLVVADADCWAPGVGWAVDRVAAGAGWVVPHWLVHRLTPGATVAVLDGRADLGSHLETARDPYVGVQGGGVTVVHRETYRRVPLDRRFTGWGQEDMAWGRALRVLVGWERQGLGPLWHLWHPPQPRLNAMWGSQESRELFLRYQQARTPEAMRALLADA
ncbi:hypothetical protein ACFVWN_01130 [Nocardiopsis flavescens]|uniref:hypothetical protein n=1 Tax=Nocardiopsis flavescens TaxID=758803 RepID=UPI00365E3DC3